MKKYVRYLLVLLMCGFLTEVKAQTTFQVDGINYYLDGSEARVSDNRDYSGSKIIIPNSVLYVGKNYPVTSIADSAFLWNLHLKEITIPNSVTTIGDRAFDGCSDLTEVTIPNSVTTIGDGAFNGCSDLTEVTIPNSVTTIGDWAFYNCYGLTTVTIGNSVTTIGDGAFFNCTSLTEVSIPNSVTTIGDGAFEGCSDLTEVTIPNSVTSIGDDAFSFCSNLTEVIWNARNAQDLQYNSRPFSGCDQLTDFVFGEEVEHIPDYLCYQLASLKNLVIPNSVTSIGTSAFDGCSGLTTVTIPNSVTTIGNGAFSECRGLTEVIWNARNAQDFPLSEFGTPSSPFLGCDRLTDFVFGEEVEHIPAYLCYDFTSLKKLVIGNSVTNIGEKAFYGCNGLTTVTIPNSVTTIGERAFYPCIYNHRTTKTNQKYPSVNL